LDESVSCVIASIAHTASDGRDGNTSSAPEVTSCSSNAADITPVVGSHVAV